MKSTDESQFSTFKYFERNNISKHYIIAFVTLAALMIVCGKIFNIYDWVQHPQFTETKVTKEWFLDHTSSFQQFIFYIFFVFDFFWAALLFIILGKYVSSKAKKYNFPWIFKLFVVLAGIAYTFDCIENFYYIFNKEYPATIVAIKIIAYTITLITVLLIWLRFSLKNRFVILKEFISSSWISILFLMIVGFSLPKAPQLNSIIVDLYYHPFWFVVVLLLIFAPIYCIVLSHYPNYFLFSKSNRKFKDKIWKISKSFGILGIVWYRNADNEGSNDYENYISFLRRTLGIFFYVAIFYMIAYTADTNFNISVKLSGFSSVLMIGLIWWLYVLKKKKDKWRLFYKSPLSNMGDLSDDIYIIKNKEQNKLKNPIRTYLIFLTSTVIAHIFLLVLLFIFECPYNLTTVTLSLLCITLQAITYTYYRTYRTLFKYSFFNPNMISVINAFPVMHNENDERSYEEKRQEIIEKFEKNAYFGQTPFFKKLSKIKLGSLSLGSMGNNVVFLQIISYFGFVNAVFLFAINLFPTWAMKINSIIIIISYFFLLYGAIVVILKHFIYYNLSKEDFAKRNKAKFFFTICVTVLGFLILNHLARFNETTANNLFELVQIEETVKKETLTLDTYVNNLPNTRYYIGCYGGGMKANAWTMTVLNALDTNNTLYDKTVCLSGASGGTIGLINYSAIKHENEEKRNSIIRDIGTENILSMDLTHLMGRDWFLHTLVPGNLKGKDRSTGAMRTYAEHTNIDNFSEAIFQKRSYRQYWKEMYEKRKNRFPILISNTTNIKGRQGMSVSIATSGNAEKVLYIGSDNILELDDDKTLSFYNATSTTNRFPLISPAATIEGKGQYNDGGIYENSGLLSAYKLYEAINELDASAKQKNTVFINIVNDKAKYVEYRMNKIMERCNGEKINISNEVSAILNSVAATEMFPGYVKDKLKLLAKQHENFSFETIYLPHKFNLDDVIAIYGTAIKDLKCVENIDAIIQANNTEIKSLMEGCSKETNTIIEPAMSRVMVAPAFDFMQYMLNHSSVQPVIEKLK